MKKSLLILIKLMLLCFFLWLSPFMQGFKNWFNDMSWPTTFLYTGQTLQLPEIIPTMNMMPMVKKEDIPAREKDIDWLPQTPTIEENNQSQKRVYIYSTHQQEAYMDQNTVYEASLYLAQLLNEGGVETIVEENDFALALRQQGLTYDDSYLISRNYLIEALMNHGGFDLIIDFHRDSLPRESAYIVDKEKNYAKMMSVLGGLGSHSAFIYERSMTLFDKSNAQVSNIMKPTMNREAYYNQDVHQNMILIEVGSDQNTYQEVKNSVEILATSILEMMKEEI